MLVEWTSLAEEQTASAFAYIASDSPAAAVEWFEQLVRQGESLSALPDQGRMVPEAQRESVREVFVGTYRLIYRRSDDRIVILTVQHQRRDLNADELR